MSDRLALTPRSGKEGIAKLRAVLGTRLDGARDLNDYERAAGRTVFVDFAWPALGLLVECDSMLAHSTPEQLQSDLNRQNELVAAGWRVLRFTYWDVRDRPKYVIKTLSQHFD